ncbi:SRPBCC family protein [Sulfitobacter porphyrae]|uniref:SRPBCC family protein n=1 Tax=Sulfitobacter porphyrae TaxID=1246864 RepID=A0ABW2BAU9_9RHOB|nr:ATPase [Sulfitobacter porphyrae]
MTDETTDTGSPWASLPLDREVVMSRVVDADRDTAFSAWTDPNQIVQWFGPAGFRTQTHEIDIQVGGVWRFDMIAPDGTIFSNRMEFLRIEPSRLIEFIHGKDTESDPDAFRMLVAFDEQDNGKTAVTLRQMHPTAERRAIVIGFGAVEYGAQTWDKFAAFVGAKHGVVAV